jgi:hypothetical protein
MSDFEAVLERLLGDPGFQSALASDPGRALSGYTLSDEERELLHAQVSSGAGEERTVEIRTTKSSMMGLFGSVAAGMGVAAAAGSGGHSGSVEALGPAVAGGPGGPLSGDESIGSAIGAPRGVEMLGSAGTESLGPAVQEGSGSVGRATVPPENYAPRIDVDGDGKWDRYTAEEGPGGISLYADQDGDGRVDFIGHDVNRDGLVDSAEYDTNFDGQFDQRMVDDDRDGWLDRTERIEPA